MKKPSVEIKIVPRGVRVYPSELKIIQKHYGTLQEFVAQKARSLAKAEGQKIIKSKALLKSKAVKKKTPNKGNTKKAKKK